MSISGSIPARVYLVVGLVAVAVYANSVVNEFVFDDRLLIEKNPIVQGEGTAGELLLAPYHLGVELSTTALYRPLALASFALDYLWSGLDPFGYHIVNILLHAAVSVLVLRLGTRLGMSSFAAAAGAVLFAVHPVHTEVVANLAGRAELLAALFYLVAMVAYSGPGSHRGRCIIAGVGLLLALLSKESAATLLGVAVLWDLTLGRRGGESVGERLRDRRFELLALVVAVAAYLALRAIALGGALVAPVVPYVDNPLVDSPLSERWATAAVVTIRYLGLLVLPIRLSPDYSYAQILPVGLANPGALVALVVVAGVLGAVVWSFRRSPKVAFLGSFAVISFLPASNVLMPIGTIMGERLLYLPSVAFCLLLGHGVGILRERLGGRGAWTILIVVVALASARTVVRNRDWRNGLALFSSAAVTSPRSVKVQSNLGAELMRRGRHEEARTALGRALEIDPAYDPARLNLAQCLLDEGEIPAAEQEIRRLLDSRADHPVALFQLGEVLLRGERFDEAEAVFRQLLSVRPESAEVHGRLGVALELLGRRAEAEAAILEAVELEPRSATLRNDLGLLYSRQGRHAESIEQLRRAVELEPDAVPLRNNLGNVLREAGELDESLEALEKAAEIRPEFPATHYNLGLTLERLGREEEAGHSYRRASELRPGYGDALRGIGRIALRAGDADRALTYLDAAIASNDDDTEAHALRARALFRSGRHDEAEPDLHRVLQLNPGSVEARNNLGILHALRGDPDGARRWWEEALEIAPDSEQIRENLRKLEQP
jgi:Flp pilus assembly protein TadD